MKCYYLHRDGQNYGPYSAEQMVQMILAGEVGGEEQVCEEGGTQWVQASSLQQEFVSHGAADQGDRCNPEAQPSAIAMGEQNVAEARRKLRVPIVGMVFSIALLSLLWAAKSDMLRGDETKDVWVEMNAHGGATAERVTGAERLASLQTQIRDSTNTSKMIEDDPSLGLWAGIKEGLANSFFVNELAGSNFFPVAVFMGLIAAVIFGIWLIRALKKLKELKTDSHNASPDAM